MKSCEVIVKKLPNFEGLELPQYQTPHASGLDLQAACIGDVHVAPGQRVLIPTGLAVSLPEGYEAQIRPRSGLALKHGITLPNAPGTIDADYRGEIQVILANIGQDVFVVTRGMRIAQMVIAEVVKAVLVQADDLSATQRGSGGFGHTGIS
ncbi:MAG: dUTP diphosphatase [Candidatus Omnitrophica bacterium]|nr:dUTP diphosphatase [Candidatus Omnitrophota bacterium]